MKTRTIVLAIPVLALSAAATADITTIDFDDVLTPGSATTVSGDHYLGQGLRFESGFTVADLTSVGGAAASDYITLGGTAPNGLALTQQHGLMLEAIFVRPNSTIAATTGMVSVLFYDTNVGTSLGTLEAYDLFGNLLGSVTEATPATLGLTLSIEAPGIHRIRLMTDGDGAVADNLAFLSVPEVPAPASIALLALAGAVRRRRRA